MQRILRRCRPLYDNRDFRVIVGLNIFLGLTYSFVGPFLSMFGTLGAGMGSFRFGIFMTITALAAIVVGTTLAHYSDTHFSRRSMLLWGSASGVIGYIGYAYLRDFMALLLVGTLILSISSITFSQVFALAREYLGRAAVPADQTAFYMNAFRMFFALSWTVGPAIASWIMVAYSFRGLFLCAALCFLGFFFLVWFRVPGTAPVVKIATGNVPTPSVLQVLRRGDLLAHFSGFVLVFASSTIGIMNLPLFVLQTLGGTGYNVGVVYSVSPFFELPLMLYFGALATKIDPARIIRLGIVIAIVYYGLLTLVRAPWHVYPLQILSAATVAVTSGLAITYFQNYLPHQAGTATNLYATATRLGSTVGYLLFGSLASRFGYRAVFLGCTVFTIMALALMCVPARREEAGTLINETIAPKDEAAAV